jgi:hypothetical protein
MDLIDWHQQWCVDLSLALVSGVTFVTTERTVCHDKTRSRSFLTKAATPCFCTFLTSSYFFIILELLALKMNGAHTVPDPKPSLLDSNFVEPSKLQLLFHPSGKYAASTHFIHIRVPFNFSQLLQTPDLIFNQYHQYI